MSGRRDVSRLPKWAQRRLADAEDRVRRAEATIPWTERGMEWFTLFHPSVRAKEEVRTIRLFTLSESGAQPVCSLGPDDCVFVGRGKKEES